MTEEKKPATKHKLELEMRPVSGTTNAHYCAQFPAFARFYLNEKGQLFGAYIFGNEFYLHAITPKGNTFVLVAFGVMEKDMSAKGLTLHSFNKMPKLLSVEGGKPLFFRGINAFRARVNEAIAVARENGKVRLELQVEQPWLLRHYARMGFLPVGKAFITKGRNATRMELQLNINRYFPPKNKARKRFKVDPQFPPRILGDIPCKSRNLARRQRH